MSLWLPVTVVDRSEHRPLAPTLSGLMCRATEGLRRLEYPMLIYIIACSLPELCSADNGIFGHASEPLLLNGVLCACSGSCCLLTQLQGGTEKALHDR